MVLTKWHEKAPRSWVSSPLGVNILLSLCGDNGPVVEKYIGISSSLRSNKTCTVKNKVLYSATHKVHNFNQVANVVTEKVDFSSSEVGNKLSEWIEQFGCFKRKKIEEYLSPDTTSALFNITTIKGKWGNSQPDNECPMMTVYNSFGYTQDVKYEARLLELPLEDDNFKLVLVVPNEKDTLHNLVRTLTLEGLEQAVNLIQPLFTFTSELDAPKVLIDSELKSNFSDKISIQHGHVDVNKNGLDINVLTCLFTHKNKPSSVIDDVMQHTPTFFFAVTFKGNTIIKGQYIP